MPEWQLYGFDAKGENVHRLQVDKDVTIHYSYPTHATHNPIQRSIEMRLEKLSETSFRSLLRTLIQRQPTAVDVHNDDDPPRMPEAVLSCVFLYGIHHHLQATLTEMILSWYQDVGNKEYAKDVTYLLSLSMASLIASRDKNFKPSSECVALWHQRLMQSLRGLFFWNSHTDGNLPPITSPLATPLHQVAYLTDRVDNLSEAQHQMIRWVATRPKSVGIRHVLRDGPPEKVMAFSSYVNELTHPGCFESLSVAISTSMIRSVLAWCSSKVADVIVDFLGDQHMKDEIDRVVDYNPRKQSWEEWHNHPLRPKIEALQRIAYEADMVKGKRKRAREESKAKRIKVHIEPWDISPKSTIIHDCQHGEPDGAKRSPTTHTFTIDSISPSPSWIIEPPILDPYTRFEATKMFLESKVSDVSIGDLRKMTLSTSSMESAIQNASDAVLARLMNLRAKRIILEETELDDQVAEFLKSSNIIEKRGPREFRVSDPGLWFTLLRKVYWWRTCGPTQNIRPRFSAILQARWNLEQRRMAIISPSKNKRHAVEEFVAWLLRTFQTPHFTLLWYKFKSPQLMFPKDTVSPGQVYHLSAETSNVMELMTKDDLAKTLCICVESKSNPIPQQFLDELLPKCGCAIYWAKEINGNNQRCIQRLLGFPTDVAPCILRATASRNDALQVERKEVYVDVPTTEAWYATRPEKDSRLHYLALFAIKSIIAQVKVYAGLRSKILIAANDVSHAQILHSALQACKVDSYLVTDPAHLNLPVDENVTIVPKDFWCSFDAIHCDVIVSGVYNWNPSYARRQFEQCVLGKSRKRKVTIVTIICGEYAKGIFNQYS